MINLFFANFFRLCEIGNEWYEINNEKVSYVYKLKEKRKFQEAELLFYRKIWFVTSYRIIYYKIIFIFEKKKNIKIKIKIKLK